MAAGRAGAARRDPVRSRRRRSEQLLGRDAIVAEALALLARDGLEAVTTRRVAQALETGSASLYVYFASRDELLTAVLDRALAEVTPTSPADGGWAERLHLFMRRWIEVLARYPGLSRVATGAIPVGEHALAACEHVLALLSEGDLTDATAAWAVDLVQAYVVAAAAEEDAYRDLARSGRTEAGVLADVTARYDDLDPGTYPHLHRLRGPLLAGSGAERLHWQLWVILNGTRATPVDRSPAATAEASDVQPGASPNDAA